MRYLINIYIFFNIGITYHLNFLNFSLQLYALYQWFHEWSVSPSQVVRGAKFINKKLLNLKNV